MFRKSQTEEDGGNRKMQSALLLKQMQQNKVNVKLNEMKYI